MLPTAVELEAERARLELATVCQHRATASKADPLPFGHLSAAHTAEARAPHQGVAKLPWRSRPLLDAIIAAVGQNCRVQQQKLPRGQFPGLKHAKQEEAAAPLLRRRPSTRSEGRGGSRPEVHRGEATPPVEAGGKGEAGQRRRPGRVTPAFSRRWRAATTGRSRPQGCSPRRSKRWSRHSPH